MDHADHVRLLRRGIRDAQDIRPSSAIGSSDENVIWADLGAGEGAFTLALADLLPPGSTIHAVDRDRGALEELARRFGRLERATKKSQRVQPKVGDFTTDLGLAGLDGVLMANSLHFVKDQAAVLARVRAILGPGGRLLLVEYDTDVGNTWVPHPISFETWRRVAVASGFAEPRLLDSHPSRFLRRIYSAATEPTG
jgi:ubiquinone/menaquinone biosynthesis C-methylase UbiE